MRAVMLSLLAFSACNTSGPIAARSCEADEQCSEGQLCFAEGCGDPGSDVVVEVSGGALTTHAPRDFQIADGTLTKAQDFDLGAPLSINGEFQRDRTSVPDPANRVSYTDTVTIRATGKSLLLPGISRIFETRFERPERGFFEMKLASGEYVITALASDRSVPPVTTSTAVQAGNPPTPVSFAFPAADGAPALTGQLIKSTDATLLPPEPVLLSTAFPNGTVPVVELQLFDVATNQPLSQRFPISSNTGEFSLTVSPEARNKSSLILVASPRDTGAPIPTKRFTLTTPLPPAISLEYGDFGAAGDVTGVVLDSVGLPVADAQVLLDGTVQGDGTFRSKIAITDADGRFVIKTLASRSEGSFALTVVPPRESRASAATRSVTVSIADGTATLTPSSLTLSDRLMVRGRVLRPGSDVGASNVAVRATVQLPSSGEVAPLPLEPAVTTTAEDGTFSLPMDEGLWRFEYFPGEQAPLSSRLVNITTEFDDKGMPNPEVMLRAVTLSRGRTVTGIVTATMGTRTGQVAPYAQLRFFRSTSVGGSKASILLGTAIANERGMYRVTLPAATPGQ